jgi:hypothetical protein
MLDSYTYLKVLTPDFESGFRSPSREEGNIRNCCPSKMPKLETKADTTYMLQLPKVSFRVVDDGQASISQTGVKSVSCLLSFNENKLNIVGAMQVVWL